MREITIKIERDEESGWYVAVWNAPGGGGLTTQAENLIELQANITEAVELYFEEKPPRPERVKLHFVEDPELVMK